MKLVLLDRDGVLNEDRVDSVRHLHQLAIFSYAAQAVALLTRAGFTNVIVTNQSVVGQGLIAEEELLLINKRLCDTVSSQGGRIDDIFYCTDTPEAPTFRRKPNPGMLLEALDKYDADAACTPMVGDALRDLEAAQRAGCPRILVRSGKGNLTLSDGLPDHVQPVIVCENLLEAAHIIINTYAH